MIIYWVDISDHLCLFNVAFGCNPSTVVYKLFMVCSLSVHKTVFIRVALECMTFFLSFSHACHLVCKWNIKWWQMPILENKLLSLNKRVYRNSQFYQIVHGFVHTAHRTTEQSDVKYIYLEIWFMYLHCQRVVFVLRICVNFIGTNVFHSMVKDDGEIFFSIFLNFIIRQPYFFRCNESGRVIKLPNNKVQSISRENPFLIAY